MLKNKLRSRMKDENGAAMIIFVFGLVIFLSITAFVVDRGLFYYQETKLQAALDSAALAASRYLPNKTNATNAAYEYVEKNGFSRDYVAVTFPSKDVVRVTSYYEMQTLFGKVMSVDIMNTQQVAAAKFARQNIIMDFPYAVFQGGPGKLTIGGKLDINAGIHSNGGVYISPGSGSIINGTVTGASANEGDYYVANVWDPTIPPWGASVKKYYNVWSCTVTGDVLINQYHQDMPDWDEQILSIAPEYTQNVFNSASLFPMWNMDNFFSLNYFYLRLYTYWAFSIPGNFSGYNPNTLPGDVPYSIRISGDFSGRNHATTFNGSVCFEQSVSFSRNVTIHGDCFVKGDLTQNGGTVLEIDGNLYVDGDCTLSSMAFVEGDIIVKDTLTKGGGTPLVAGGNIYAGDDFRTGGSLILKDGVIYTRGDFISYTGGMNVKIIDTINNKTTNTSVGHIINGVVIADGDLDFGGMRVILGESEENLDLNASPITITLRADSQSTLSVYSRYGDITFDGSAGGTTVYGMVYAPHGKLTVGSGNLQFNGSLIAETMSFSSGGVTLGRNNRPLPYDKATNAAVLVE